MSLNLNSIAETAQRQSMSVSFRYAVLAVLFALCGAWTAGIFSIPQPHGASALRAWVQALLAVLPFAGCCSLFLRHTWRSLFAVFLMCAVWLLALISAMSVALWGGINGDRYGICLGGLIGGTGLVLSSPPSYKRLLSWKYIIAGGVIGTISAIPLVWDWESSHTLLRILAFAI